MNFKVFGYHQELVQQEQLHMLKKITEPIKLYFAELKVLAESFSKRRNLNIILVMLEEWENMYSDIKFCIFSKMSHCTFSTNLFDYKPISSIYFCVVFINFPNDSWTSAKNADEEKKKVVSGLLASEQHRKLSYQKRPWFSDEVDS